jgi:hypothetical protein
MANRFLSNLRINDAYTFPASDGTTGQAIITDGSGNLSFSTISLDSGSTVIYQDNFTGDNLTTTFTLANSVNDEVLTQIYIDGVYQNKDTYTVVSDVITFSQAPFSGADIEVISIVTATAQGESTVQYYVKNTTGATLSGGTAVMATGTDGNSGHILVAPMVADGTVEPKYYIGVLADDIANGEFGYAVHFGTVIKVNTNAFNDGDVLWVDPSTPGGFTATEPNAPSVKLATAIVLNSSTNGKIFVRVQGNEGLHELHDVHISSIADGQVLVWDNANEYWKNSNTVSSLTSTGDINIGAYDSLKLKGGQVPRVLFNSYDFYATAWYSIEAYSNLEFRVDTDKDGYADFTAGAFTSDGSFNAYYNVKAPIYYDRDNTAYYLDPNSATTSLNVAGRGKFESSVKVADDTDLASASNVGALRYREDVNGSYVDMCMKTSSTPTYAWVNIVQNTF